MKKTSRTKKLTPTDMDKDIVREKVWMDTKLVDTSCYHLDNKVTYALFKSDSDPSVIPENFAQEHALDTHSCVCFSGLLHKLISGQPNRMYDRLEIQKCTTSTNKFLLTPEERVEWLLLAKKHKMLPPYIDENAITDIPEGQRKSTKVTRYGTSTTAIASGEFIIDLEGLSPVVLYIYLSTIRNIREDPGLPRAVTYLVNKLGMNFFAAYVFASRAVLNLCGHHTIDIQRPYGLSKSGYDEALQQYVKLPADQSIMEAQLVPLEVAIGLQRVVSDVPLKYDTRRIVAPDGKAVRFSSYSFNCADTIRGISKVKHNVSFQELFDEDVVGAVMSKDDAEGRKFLDKYLNKKDRIKYKEASK